MPRCGIAGSLDNSMCHLLKNCQSIFQRDCPIRNSHQECMRARFSVHVVTLVIGIAMLAGVPSHVVLACISLMANDAEHFFLCLLAVCMFSLEKYLFRSLAYLKIVLFVFLLFSCKSSSHILHTSPLSAISLASIFSCIFCGEQEKILVTFLDDVL